MPETTPEVLQAYLREHGERFSSRALRNEHVSQGYDPALVEAAITAYDAEPRSGKRSGGPWAAGCTAFAIGTPVALLNLGFLVYKTLGLANAGTYTSRAEARIGEGFHLWLALLVAELVVGLLLLLAGWLTRERAPGFSILGRGLGSGLALGVALIVPVSLLLSLLLFGVCAGMLRGPR